MQTDTTSSFIQSQIVRIQCHFTDNDKKRTEYGCGFILQGKYLATCYHLILPQGNEKLISVDVVYNEKIDNGIFTYDIVLATTDFEAEGNQFDFSKHEFNVNDRQTDFIVLKLINEIKPVTHHFAKDTPQYNDVVYCIGNTLTTVNGVSTINPNFQIVNAVMPLKLSPTQVLPFIGTIVTNTHGFSGTPLYNNIREIVGMVQFSFESLPMDIYLQYKNNNINDAILKRMVDAYNSNLKLQYSLDIKYIIANYLYGYL